MRSHCNFVWKHMMPKCAAAGYALVAHSAGGMCVEDLWAHFKPELTAKLRALVFTDSGYHGMLRDMSRKEHRLMQRIAIHYRACHDFTEVGTVFAN